MTEFLNSHTYLAVKLYWFWPLLRRLCVGNEEGSDCAGSAIFGTLAIEFFVNIKQRG